MKKLLLPVLAVLFLTGCQKEITTVDVSQEGGGADANEPAKITVCHYDAVTGHSKTIEVSQNDLPGHLSHSDIPGDCSAVLTTICDQDWMVKNLDATTYRNGDPIPQVTDRSAWMTLTTGAWCYYDNSPSKNGTSYGKLYNWYAVNDSRGLAPQGWHVPSHAEWNVLTNCLGGYAIAGGKMKSTGTLEGGTGLWLSPNIGSTNSSGFTGHPGGIRIGTIAIDFSSINHAAYWWSSTDYSSERAWNRMANFNSSILDWGIGVTSGEPPFIKTHGMAVRCVRD